MKTSLDRSESKFFERARIALTNAESHAEIKPLIAEYGMDEPKITEGWAVYNKALASSDKNNQEEIEKNVASTDYKDAFSNFLSLFKRHRNQAGIFFKKNPEFLIRLGIKGSFPSKYTEIFDAARLFYEAIQANPAIQDKLSIAKITPEVVTESLSNLDNVKALRASFDKENGEAQDATVQKNIDILELKDWMEDFDIIAKLALYDKPQLLEVLGIFVRS